MKATIVLTGRAKKNAYEMYLRMRQLWINSQDKTEGRNVGQSIESSQGIPDVVSVRSTTANTPNQTNCVEKSKG